MEDLLILLAHLLTTLAKLPGPGGPRAIVADSLPMKQQLLVINRSQRRAPDRSALDRFLLDFWSQFLNPHFGCLRIAQQVTMAFDVDITRTWSGVSMPGTTTQRPM